MKVQYYLSAIIISITLLFAYLYQLSYTMVVATIFALVGTFVFVDLFYRSQTESAFVKKNLGIAKSIIMDNDKFIIMIVKNERILWANDLAYSEFPVILNNRKINKIKVNTVNEENHFTYNNKIYELLKKDAVYTIVNVTEKIRLERILNERQPNIGIFQIDNYNYLLNQDEGANVASLFTNLKRELIKWFDENEIFHQTIGEDRFQLLFPTSKLNSLTEEKFKSLYTLVSQFVADDFPITYSMGIATNFSTTYEVGKKANDAIELAVARGGAQTVMFDNDQRIVFGGGRSVIQVNSRIKARVIANTMVNILKKHDIVYLMTHHHPDADALASMYLMKKFIEDTSNCEMKIIIDENISDDLKIELEMIEDNNYHTDFVVDLTKSNLVIVVDTQSSKIISHPQLLEQVENVIVIDHHQTPASYIQKIIFNWIETTASSTVELVVEMLNAKDVKIQSKPLANLGLLGILTDSSNLKYSTGQHTLEAMSILVSYGGNIEASREKEYLGVEGFITLNNILSKLKIVNEFAIIEVEGIDDNVLLAMAVNSALEIKGVEASIILSSTLENVIIKMRSNSSTNSKLFLEEFDGGGHGRLSAAVISHEQVPELMAKITSFKKGQ